MAVILSDIDGVIFNYVKVFILYLKSRYPHYRSYPGYIAYDDFSQYPIRNTLQKFYNLSSEEANLIFKILQKKVETVHLMPHFFYSDITEAYEKHYHTQIAEDCAPIQFYTSRKVIDNGTLLYLKKLVTTALPFLNDATLTANLDFAKKAKFALELAVKIFPTKLMVVDDDPRVFNAINCATYVNPKFCFASPSYTPFNIRGVLVSRPWNRTKVPYPFMRESIFKIKPKIRQKSFWLGYFKQEELICTCEQGKCQWKLRYGSTPGRRWTIDITKDEARNYLKKYKESGRK